MSTLLFPVGPHEPRVYWVRRAVVVVVLVVVLIVLIELFSGGSSKPKAKDKANPHVTTSTSAPATTSSSAPATTQVTACDPSTLKLTLSTDSDSYKSGQAAKLIGVFSNPATTACTLSVAPSQEIWTIKSGPPTVWTTHGCTSSKAPKQATIKAGGIKQVSIIWNGFRSAVSGCGNGPVATAGEYTLHATLDGVTASKAAIFHVTS
ncbi:MAG TPA: hypothetical protein VHV79_00620 [Mycobacteriales bacterium]|nr:hypothetical protein [Mycobacteriales bacterium]